MANIVLIHGYGVGLSPSKHPLEDLLGFAGFYDLLLRKKVAVFAWHQEENHSPLYFFNPRNHYQVYQKEKSAATSGTVFKSLEAFLQKEQPVTLVCHSLGALLLLTYINHHKLPDSVKKVVLVQADVPADLSLVTREKSLRELTAAREVLNVYCPWDPALITSKVLHKYNPAGLTKISTPQIKNKMIPLFGHWNLHTATIMQKQFAQFVASL